MASQSAFESSPSASTVGVRSPANMSGVAESASPTAPDPAGDGSAGVPAGLSLPRLARHTFTLADGHRIGLSVSGRGVPLVVVHGFTAEGFLYAQTLSRLVRKGFKVIAIDMAGHGGTEGLPASGGRLTDYAELMSRCVTELGIRRAVFAGHSMGGRVVAQLAALHPDRVIALLLVDAIVGDTWDRIVNLSRLNPFILGGVGAALVVDSAMTAPVLRDRDQAVKLGRLATPTIFGHATQPWRLLGPGISILRSRGTRGILEALAREEIPTFVIHGDRDVAVPPCTARSAARRANGQLVMVHGGGHSWLLRDPESLPAIVSELLEGRLGAAIRRALTAAGARSVDQLEDIFYDDDAPILALTPELAYTGVAGTPRRPAYTWTTR